MTNPYPYYPTPFLNLRQEREAVSTILHYLRFSGLAFYDVLEPNSFSHVPSLHAERNPEGQVWVGKLQANKLNGIKMYYDSSDALNSHSNSHLYWPSVQYK